MPVLVALCLTVYLPGFFSIPPVDRDESRFAQASRQMFESVALPEAEQTAGFHDGGLVVPKFQDKPRLNKPPLIYWFQSAAAAVFTGGDPLKDAIWMYRVPSLLAGIGTVLLVWFLGKSMFNRRVAFLGAAFLALSPVFVWEAHQARADQVLVFWTVLAQVALWKGWKKAQRGGLGDARTWVWAGVFWCAFALGVLTKGPITPLVSGLTVLALCITTRRWRWVWGLKPIVGVVLAAAIVAPWVIAIGNHPLVGWDRLFEIANDEVFGRSIEAKEGHWGPPGYHLLLLPVLLWPGSMMVGIAFPFAIRRVFTSQNRARKEAALGLASSSPAQPSTKDTQSKARRLPYPNPARNAELFILAWIIPTWLVFELVGTKLPHYTMPLYPAVAILCARTLLAAQSTPVVPMWRWIVRLGLHGWSFIGLVLAVVAFWAGMSGFDAHDWHSPPIVLIWASFILMVFLAIEVWDSVIRERFINAAVLGIAVMALFAITTLGLGLPFDNDELWISRRLHHRIDAIDSNRPLAAITYHEDSLVFMQRGRLDRINLQDLPAWLDQHPNGVVIIDHKAYEEQTDLRPLSPKNWGVGGFNYSRGERVHLVIAERAE